jgi:hypothetical protein
MAEQGTTAVVGDYDLNQDVSGLLLREVIRSGDVLYFVAEGGFGWRRHNGGHRETAEDTVFEYKIALSDLGADKDSAEVCLQQIQTLLQHWQHSYTSLRLVSAKGRHSSLCADLRTNTILVLP